VVVIVNETARYTLTNLSAYCKNDGVVQYEYFECLLCVKSGHSKP